MIMSPRPPSEGRKFLPVDFESPIATSTFIRFLQRLSRLNRVTHAEFFGSRIPLPFGATAPLDSEDSNFCHSLSVTGTPSM